MKKTSLICGLLLTYTYAFPADLPSEDPLTASARALRFSLHEPVLGTARYASMAGAMGALGGDQSALKDNPAALGIFRKSDLSFSPSLNYSNNGFEKFKANNFGVVFNLGIQDDNRSGYVTSSFALSYNRLANFERSINTDGITPNRLSSYTNQFVEENGAVMLNMAYGINFKNKFYGGIGFNVLPLKYKQYTLSNFRKGNEENYFENKGCGWNLSLGGIVRLRDWVRLGASLTTPTFYTIGEKGKYPVRDDEGNLEIESYKIVHNSYYSPLGIDELKQPMKCQVSAGFIIGKRALFDIDYSASNYKSLNFKFNDSRWNNDYRDFVKDNFKTQHTIKLGTEVQLGNGFSARAGFAYQSSPTNEDCNIRNMSDNKGLYVPTHRPSILYSYAIPRESNYVTLGVGRRGRKFYGDLAYVHRSQREDFYEWQQPTIDNGNIVAWEIDPIKHKLKSNYIIATLGLRW